MAYVPRTSFSSGIGRIMGVAGADCTLQRSGLSDLSLKAKRFVKGSPGGDIVNAFADAEAAFRLGNDELAAVPAWGAPQRGDVLVDNLGTAYKVLHVDTRDHGGQVLAHTLYVAGA